VLAEFLNIDNAPGGGLVHSSSGRTLFTFELHAGSPVKALVIGLFKKCQIVLKIGRSD
jgi:hypothetical protein